VKLADIADNSDPLEVGDTRSLSAEGSKCTIPDFACMRGRYDEVVTRTLAGFAARSNFFGPPGSSTS
jgi:hypothetical protein